MTYRIAITATQLLCLSILAGCAGAGAGPASQRGFFSGIGAAASGEDERGAARLEHAASLEERSAALAAERSAGAKAAAARSGAEVQAAQRRLAALQQRLRGQRATLERLRSLRGEAGAGEVARLQSQMDALERDQRDLAQRAGGPSPEAVQRVEQRAGELDVALRRFGAI